MGRGLLCALMLLVTLPATAHAGTVAVQGDVLYVTGTPGVREFLSVYRSAGDTHFGISDGSATIGLGAGCTSAHPQPTVHARCDAAGVQRIVIDAGDQDDRASVADSITVPVTVDLGPGDDRFQEGGVRNDVRGGEGDDWLDSSGSNAGTWTTFDGGAGYDSANYTQRWGSMRLSLDDVANDGLPGEQDNLLGVEHVYGGYDDDVITGSAGDDVLYGGMGVDEIHGLGGDDTLEGSLPGYGDRLYGGEDDDVMQLTGSAIADAGPGDDTFTSGYASSCWNCVAIGGPGEDRVDFSDDQFHAHVRLSLDNVANDGEPGGAANFRSDIEHLIGPDSPATLIGSAGPNVIVGGYRDDVLIGGGGSDELHGGPGFDTADYSTHTAPVTLTLDGRRNDGAPGEHDLIGTDVEDLRGGSAADVLVGDDADNLLDGGPGADRLEGLGGVDGADYSLRSAPVRARLDGSTDSGEAGEGDTIAADVEGAIGGSGGDLLIGNALDGFLFGEGGNDRLLDRGGEDDLDGGDGADQLDSFDGRTDTVSCGDGPDRLWINQNEDVDGTCETIAFTARPADPDDMQAPRLPPAVAVPTPTPRPVDRTAPRALRVSVPKHTRAKTLRRSGLATRVRCDEPCRLSATLSRRGRTIATATRAAPSAAERLLRLRVKRTPARGSYRLTLTLTDLAGNAATTVRTIRVR
jgi:Ca2+-binding RTX toxin-like protein